jgi:hypothetical protein
VLTDVSKDNSAFTFRVRQSKKSLLLPLGCFILKMWDFLSFEMSYLPVFTA